MSKKWLWNKHDHIIYELLQILVNNTFKKRYKTHNNQWKAETLTKHQCMKIWAENIRSNSLISSKAPISANVSPISLAGSLVLPLALCTSHGIYESYRKKIMTNIFIIWSWQIYLINICKNILHFNDILTNLTINAKDKAFLNFNYLWDKKLTKVIMHQ